MITDIPHTYYKRNLLRYLTTVLLEDFFLFGFMTVSEVSDQIFSKKANDQKQKLFSHTVQTETEANFFKDLVPYKNTYNTVFVF